MLEYRMSGILGNNEILIRGIRVLWNDKEKIEIDPRPLYVIFMGRKSISLEWLFRGNHPLPRFTKYKILSLRSIDQSASSDTFDVASETIVSFFYKNIDFDISPNNHLIKFPHDPLKDDRNRRPESKIYNKEKKFARFKFSPFSARQNYIRAFKMLESVFANFTILPPFLLLLLPFSRLLEAKFWIPSFARLHRFPASF